MQPTDTPFETNPGQTRPDWYTIVTREGETHFMGILAASDTSISQFHNHPNYDLSHDRTRVERFAAKGERCNACRWQEVYVYVINDDAREYVIHTIGKSIVPGEVDFQRVRRTTSAYKMIELMTVRKPGSDPYLTPVNARALARLAEFYDDVRDAYVNRAVV